ncbi:hypothetical protein AKJ16_DCAP18612 [Drosera capensis]
MYPVPFRCMRCVSVTHRQNRPHRPDNRRRRRKIASTVATSSASAVLVSRAFDLSTVLFLRVWEASQVTPDRRCWGG